VGESGQSVEKWVIFKYPEGTDYAYWDPNTPLHRVQNASLNATESGPLANTLNPLWLYYMSQYIMWNDEIPNSAEYNETAGHSKGVWMWDVMQDVMQDVVGEESTGVFLQHSIPKWPLSPAESPEGYAGLPSNAWTYGQHIACFTVAYTELQTLSQQYTYIRPSIYAQRGEFPLLHSDSSERHYHKHQDPTCQYTKYPNATLVGFAKNAEWDKDLYAGCIAPTLQQGLFVESWRHGVDPLGPSCGSLNVLDVQALTVAGRSFTTADDHSKWAVATEGDYVCFSDINRMETQFKRGGGAICFEDAPLAADLRGAIDKTDRC
jgi:deoxyribonuclease-2